MQVTKHVGSFLHERQTGPSSRPIYANKAEFEAQLDVINLIVLPEDLRRIHPDDYHRIGLRDEFSNRCFIYDPVDEFTLVGVIFLFRDYEAQRRFSDGQGCSPSSPADITTRDGNEQSGKPASTRFAIGVGIDSLCKRWETDYGPAPSDAILKAQVDQSRPHFGYISPPTGLSESFPNHLFSPEIIRANIFNNGFFLLAAPIAQFRHIDTLRLEKIEGSRKIEKNLDLASISFRFDLEAKDFETALFSGKNLRGKSALPATRTYFYGIVNESNEIEIFNCCHSFTPAEFDRGLDRRTKHPLTSKTACFGPNVPHHFCCPDTAPSSEL